MADNQQQQQQVDHYDFINAPQFVDFSDLAAQDDPDADRFFETHREEDDFMIPLDINAISPTVQLLYGGEEEENQHYSNEANKAAMAAGLEDVKIEYYASPPQQQLQSTAAVSGLSQPNSANKKSITSVYGTPLGVTLSGSSSATSFYTPTGGNEDKENQTPSSLQKKFGGDHILQQQQQRNNILGQQAQKLEGSPQYSSPATVKKSDSYTPTAAQSLMSRLDQLLVLTSDEDEDEDKPEKDNQLETPPKPQLSSYQPTVALPEADVTFTTFSGGKSAYLGLPSASIPTAPSMEGGNNSSYMSETDATLVVNASNDETGFLKTPPQRLPVTEYPSDSSSSSSSSSSDDDQDCDDIGGSMEMHSPVNKILKILEQQLSLDDNDDEEDNPRSSILVAPYVGHQVHWNADPGAGEDVAGAAGGESYDASGETTLEYYPHGISPIAYPNADPCPNRRSSSVGDLVRAIEVRPKDRPFQTYGYNPRVGITIPKTPDVLGGAVGGGGESEGEMEEQVPALRPEGFSSNKNSCYFEIDPPTKAPPPKAKSLRRVSSCSDLISIQQQAKLDQQRRNGPGARKIPPKKGLTIPRTPDTMKRVQKSQAAKAAAAAGSSAGSTSSKIGAPSMRGKVTATVPKGPSVSERLAAARSRQPVKANHYVSMAEAMINYQKNTPDRFRSLPRGRMVPEKRAASNDSRRRAAPSPARSPDCSVMSVRSRGDSFSERREAHHTAAVRNAGPVLPKKVELKPTVPRPFNLSCGTRARANANVPKEEDVPDFKFKARPAPSKAVHDNHSAMLLKSRPQVKVTQPMSPHFASDDRLRERHQKRAQTKSPEPKSKATAASHSKPSRLPTSSAPSSARGQHHYHPIDEHKTTVAQPFSSSFDARQKEILRRKEEKIKQELEEARKGREFHANPVPKFSSSKLPKKKPVEVTYVEPFKLKSDERGAMHQEMLKKKLEEEEQRSRELAQFHAQPADVIHKPPFEPERPTRIIEGPLDFHLATEKRAAEREQFDEQLREREREEEERRREEQEKLEELQRLEDIERRRQLVHKAQPFKAPKPFQLKSSGRPLTVPQSPAFSALPSERRVIKPQSPQSGNH